jgi:hypothetical protein
MNGNRFFKTNWSKIVALLLLFAVIAFFGGLLFSWGYRFQKRTWLLRGSYMAIAVLWVVMSIRAICIKVHFGALWRGMMDEIYKRAGHYENSLYQNYQDLNSRYPMAVAEFESHCWHQHPRPTNSEIMEMALKISEIEWSEREKKAREKVASKHSSHTS